MGDRSEDSFGFCFSRHAYCRFSAQIPSTPGMPPAAQAQQAFAFAQAQSMMITNQAQLQGLIASQAAMLTSMQARSMFLAQAASLQARVTANQGAMFSAQVALWEACNTLWPWRGSFRCSPQSSACAAGESKTHRRCREPCNSPCWTPLSFPSTPRCFMRRRRRRRDRLLPARLLPTSPHPDAASLPAEPPPMMIRPTFGNALVVDKPVFSVPPGAIQPGTKISIRSETHYATLYYTTNGWTPTTQSAKYTGPITINSSTHLEVIAVGPNFLRSSVERADYQVANSPAPVLESTVSVPGRRNLASRHAGTSRFLEQRNRLRISCFGRPDYDGS